MYQHVVFYYFDYLLLVYLLKKDSKLVLIANEFNIYG